MISIRFAPNWRRLTAELQKHGAQLMPVPMAIEDRVAALAVALGKGRRAGSVYIDVEELTSVRPSLIRRWKRSWRTFATKSASR